MAGGVPWAAGVTIDCGPAAEVAEAAAKAGALPAVRAPDARFR